MEWLADEGLMLLVVETELISPPCHSDAVARRVCALGQERLVAGRTDGDDIAATVQETLGAFRNSREQLVEAVVENDDSTVAQRICRCFEIVLGQICGMSAINAHQPAPAARECGEIGAPHGARVRLVHDDPVGAAVPPPQVRLEDRTICPPR